ncbi:hypothetical protein ACA910_018753 [Epithemia clementina (nom. ined.)]
MEVALLFFLAFAQLPGSLEAFSVTGGVSQPRPQLSQQAAAAAASCPLWRRCRECSSRQHRFEVPMSSSSSTNAATSESDGSRKDSSMAMPSSTMNGITPNGATPKQEKEFKDKQKQQLEATNFRAQAGPLSFKAKYGVLNPYGIWYGFVAIFLGIPWFAALTLYQCFTILTRGKFDKQRFVPNLFNQIWGTILMRLTRSYPKVEGLDILKEFYEKGKPCMFVANHNSWMDIPIVGSTIGWRNYKFVAKKELAKVPILSTAIRVAGHLMVDRSDKRSGLKTLKAGIQYLKDGVHLITFPEGTRSRDGRLLEFKNGAFKMAHKAGAPIIPFTIAGAQVAHPLWAIFPIRASHNVCNITVHEPIESVGKSEEELAEAVRQQMIDGLPADQKPLA